MGEEGAPGPGMRVCFCDTEGARKERVEGEPEVARARGERERRRGRRRGRIGGAQWLSQAEGTSRGGGAGRGKKGNEERQGYARARKGPRSFDTRRKGLGRRRRRRCSTGRPMRRGGRLRLGQGRRRRNRARAREREREKEWGKEKREKVCAKPTVAGSQREKERGGEGESWRRIRRERAVASSETQAM